jgi:stage V sporulation protein B
LMKLIINLTLIPIPSINIKGAILGSITCHVVTATINILALNRKIRLNFTPGNLIIKPVIAAVLTGIWAHCSYRFLTGITDSNMYCTAFSIITSVAVYLLLIVLSGSVKLKEVYTMIPGKKLHSMSVLRKKQRR